MLVACAHSSRPSLNSHVVSAAIFDDEAVAEEESFLACDRKKDDDEFLLPLLSPLQFLTSAMNRHSSWKVIEDLRIDNKCIILQ